jgi:hypothetical protein
MTILEQYEPESYNVNTAQVYEFTFPCADPSVVEVYENVDEVTRYLLPVTDYQLTFEGTFDLPLLTQGTVTFNVPHREDVTSVTFERNTLIAQTVVLPSLGSFNSFRGDIIEFTLDKAMMICQEITVRKCAEIPDDLPMTQEIIFGAYDTFSASLVNFQVDKTIQILQQIDASAIDCRDKPEQT